MNLLNNMIDWGDIESRLSDLNHRLVLQEELLVSLQMQLKTQDETIERIRRQVDDLAHPIAPKTSPKVFSKNEVSEPQAMKEPCILYFGAPMGKGFQKGYELQGGEANPQALYKVSLQSEYEATFEPLLDKFVRFKNNESSFFSPMCDSSGSMPESSGMKVVSCGCLHLENEFWTITKKCCIEFS